MIPKIGLLINSEPVGRFFGGEIHRMFGLDQQTLIQFGLVIFNVSILAFILSKLLYKPVLNFLNERTLRIKEQIKRAEEDQKSADTLKAEYESKLRNIEAEKDEILEAARKTAANNSKQVLDEAKTEAEAIRDRALRNMEMEKERVKDEVRQSIIDVSAIMAQKFVVHTMDADTQNKLFAEVMAELGDADFSQASRAVV